MVVAQVKYIGDLCNVVKEKFPDGGTSIRLVHSETGEPYATATIGGFFPNNPDIVVIKDYSENKGMLGLLEEAKVVKHTGMVVETGLVASPICKVLV